MEILHKNIEQKLGGFYKKRDPKNQGLFTQSSVINQGFLYDFPT